MDKELIFLYLFLLKFDGVILETKNMTFDNGIITIRGRANNELVDFFLEPERKDASRYLSSYVRLDNIKI